MNSRRLPFATLLCVASFFAAQAAPATPITLTAQQWTEIGTALRAAAEQERTGQGIPSIAVGIVSAGGQGWHGVAGFADARKESVAGPQALYRIGSLTKLMTDVLVMQLVERGTLNLDTPVRAYLSSFAPRDPYSKPVTLRMLMSHHAGLVEEPPRGHYYDPNPPSLAEVVRSLNGTTLIAEPGTTYHYSNAGLAVVGRVLEVVTSKPYEQLLREALLQPLGMSETSLRASPEVRARLAYGEIAPYDGTRFAAPVFDLGPTPAGNVYSSVPDVLKFARSLLEGGLAANGRILQGETIASMWQPQYPPAGDERPGIGFFLRSLDGHRVASHSGSVYGYVADLSVYPDDGFATTIMIALGEANPVRRRLRDFAARLVLAAQAGEATPRYAMSDAVPAYLGRRIAGHYVGDGGSVDLRVMNGRTFLEAPDVAAELRRIGNRWVLDDVFTSRDDVSVDADSATVEVGGVRYRRIEQSAPALPDPELAGLIGDYGQEFGYLRIYERDGRPYARTDWQTYQPLERVSRDVYRLEGVEPREELRFSRDRKGGPRSVELGGIVFERRDFGAEANERVRAVIHGNRGLRAQALKATPPAPPADAWKPDLVEVVSIEPGIRLDIGYATKDNFMGMPVYDEPRAFMQRPAAEALARAHRRLMQEHGFGILIHDTYRPWYVTKMFWDATPPASRDFVADPAQGSKHNRGCAADITLYDRSSGVTLEMPGLYDEMSSRSSPLFVGGSSLQRWRRDVLKEAVEAEGYAVYEMEWWHFDYATWQHYPVMNVKFDEVPAGAAGTPVGAQR